MCHADIYRTYCNVDGQNTIWALFREPYQAYYLSYVVGVMKIAAGTDLLLGEAHEPGQGRTITRPNDNSKWIWPLSKKIEQQNMTPVFSGHTRSSTSNDTAGMTGSSTSSSFSLPERWLVVVYVPPLVGSRDLP